MAVSMSSKTKVGFVGKTTENIITTQKRLSATLEEMRTVANSAKYAAVDRVYNALAELSTSFSEVLCVKDKKVLTEIIDGLVKRTDIGESFVASAKKTKGEVESIPNAVTYEKITVEREGDETWDASMAARLDTAITEWTNVRKDFIVEFSDAFKGIEEEEFRTSVKPIGKANEEFTNSIVSSVQKVSDALAELNIDINKFNANMADTTSSANIGTADVKVNLQAADF